ncbi:MAG: hypothetical protein AB1414_09685 [bacterium]
MPIKINLRFHELPDYHFLDQGILLWLRRIITTVSFATPDGWSQPRPAIVDTGSYACLIPQSIWKESLVKMLSSTTFNLHGLIRKSKDVLPVYLGEITCVILDDIQVSPPISLKSYLALEDDCPLLLGFEGILSSHKLICDYPNKAAYFEIYP